MTKRLGLIQSRGLGDLVIALPIADYYHKQGWEIHWPICKEFVTHFEMTAPWVNWHAVDTDQRGTFFLEQPQKILEDLACDEIMPLYQALTGQPFHETEYFQHTKFDQYKYIRAGVPFVNKWRLADCITRDLDREQTLLQRIHEECKGRPFALIHVQGSDHRAQFDTDILPKDWAHIEINNLTDRCWDWISALEAAEAVILVDSVFANMVDQLNLNTDEGRYLIPRSHIGLTPVYGAHWTWLKNYRLQVK